MQKQTKGQTKVHDIALIAVSIWLMVRGVKLVVWAVKKPFRVLRRRKNRL